MVFGKFAIGCDMSVLKYWLLSAVNNNGAVSPAMRAKANSTPVMTPALADFRVIEPTNLYLGAPNA